jgi:ectoine hydroxylase-related dioxygenase (phytanoyl-CoA dioxygenase family)
MTSPFGAPGPLTDMERFLFDTAGYLVIPGALSPEETDACLKAAHRVHAPYPKGQWRQLGNTFEQEEAFENLIDHPSVMPKVRALLGDHFILQSSWCTVQPSGGKGGGFHQDGSGPYEFRRLAIPTPLLQVRIGYYLTDQSKPKMGNLVLVPGSHNASLKVPKEAIGNEDAIPIRDIVCGEPGTAVIFHQGVFHCSGTNDLPTDRYTMHMIYSPPWLMRSDRLKNSEEFMARTTPLRRALMGEWTRPEEPFGMGYERPPFEG